MGLCLFEVITLNPYFQLEWVLKLNLGLLEFGVMLY
jgi:hypothetical protein